MEKEIEIIECYECGKEIEEGDAQYFDDNVYCEDCLQEITGYCEICDEYYLIDDLTSVGDQVLCESCRNDNYVQCYGCGEWTPNDNYHSVGWHEYCGDCFDENFFYCDSCGEVESSEHYNDEGLCQECSNRSIHSCSHVPEFIFYGASNPYFGVELEIECKNDRKEVAETILEKWSKDESLFYLKNDGSLNNGFEIVTHPCNMQYHLTEFPWHDLTEHLSRAGCKSHDTSTCGLHIHINKKSMALSEQIKFGIFINTQKERVERISRRTESHYAKFKHIEKKIDANKSGGNGRYEAINWTNNKTIEFRAPRGTLKANTILATIQFLHSVISWVKETSTPKVADVSKSWDHYIDFLKKCV